MSEEKTFTQEEVNQIVQERLQREKNKQPELEQREKDLEKRERAFQAKELLQKHNLPEEFQSFLEASEDMNAAVMQITQGINACKASTKPVYEPRSGEPHDKSEELRKSFGLYD